MSRATVVARGRAAAEAGMVDTCRIRRQTGTTTDDFSGEVVDTYETLYEGKCRLQQPGAEATAQDAGQAYVLLQRIQVQLPISVTGLVVGDEVEMTGAGRDPDLVGRVFLVHDLPRKTDATARRVSVQEQTS